MDDNAYRRVVFLPWVGDERIRLEDRPEWVRHQAMQYDYLVRQGLSPSARVLDVATQTLGVFRRLAAGTAGQSPPAVDA